MHVFTKYKTHRTYVDYTDINNISIILQSLLILLIPYNILKYILGIQSQQM
jgi:hypothetical protein